MLSVLESVPCTHTLKMSHVLSTMFCVVITLFMYYSRLH